MDRFSFRSLIAVLFGMTIMLSSCASNPKRIDSMIGRDGKPAGVVIDYGRVIDITSITSDTYQTPGLEITKVFASNKNIFKKNSGKKKNVKSKDKNGRYMVIFLKQKAEEAVIEEVRVKQISPILTESGKTLKPWTKAVKAKEAYPVL